MSDYTLEYCAFDCGPYRTIRRPNKQNKAQASDYLRELIHEAGVHNIPMRTRDTVCSGICAHTTPSINVYYKDSLVAQLGDKSFGVVDKLPNNPKDLVDIILQKSGF